MADLNIPSNQSEIFTRIATEVKQNLPSSDPWLTVSWIRSLLQGMAGMSFEEYQKFNEITKQFFIRTATGEFLEDKAQDEGISRNPATQAQGLITTTGVVGTTVPSGTQYADSEGELYTVQNGVAVGSVSNSVTMLWNSTTVTLTFSIDHNLANGTDVTITGATEPKLNGTFSVTVLTDTTATYNVPTLTATGADSGSAGYDIASLTVKSESFGEALNKDSGESLAISTPIVNLSQTATVQASAIGGGADSEADDALRERTQFKLRNPLTHFNDIDIELNVLENSFVKRVFVNRITPDVGQVTVYALKEDNEAPTSGELVLIKDNLKEIIPSNTDFSDVFVLAPIADDIDFTFTLLAPDTATMRSAVENNLSQYFVSQADIGVDIPLAIINAVIAGTIDTQTGDRISNFTLTVPSVDIVVAAGHIAKRGTVTWP